MDKTQIILFVAAMLFLAFRLYQKYYKKVDPDASTDKNKTSGGAFFASTKDDDYEPYAKK